MKRPCDRFNTVIPDLSQESLDYKLPWTPRRGISHSCRPQELEPRPLTTRREFRVQHVHTIQIQYLRNGEKSTKSTAHPSDF